jgi:pSer/pThr/pTyr-binding forkhead associated (FHA) protein
MRCSACGHESPPGSSFCLNCGSALAPAAQTPASGGGLPAICGVCRGENPPGMKFCRACGAALTQTSPAAPAYGAPGMGPPPTAMPAGPLGTPAPRASSQPGPPGMMPPPSTLPQGPAGGLAQRAQGSTITCPRCGTSTPVGFAYCQQCGLHLQPIAPTDPGQAPRIRAPSNAGALGASPILGAPVDPQGATIAQPDPRPSTGGGGIRPSQAPASVPASTVPDVARAPATGPAWGSAVLVNRDGSDGERFSLSSEDTVIGRAGADIAFDDDRFLARQHARITRAADGSVSIHPIDALNGVFQKATSPIELDDGTTILVGREVLRFEKVAPEERTVHPLVRHGVSLFGSPPREPWGRLFQLVPSGGYRDVRHLIGDETVLGREEGDIVFRDDAFMSRRHAAVTWDGRIAKVTDLGSSNGTFVRIAGPTPLKHGDHVRMGDQLLRLELAR